MFDITLTTKIWLLAPPLNTQMGIVKRYEYQRG
jgi:hypothetical protein